MWKGLFIRIRYNKTRNMLAITANKVGLDLLISYSLSIIGKHDPSGHHHLQKGFGNVTGDSDEAVIYFSDDDEDYQDKLKGRDSRFKIIFEEEIVLMGDEKGLESFAELCREAIKYEKPIRLDKRMQNILPGSIPTVLKFKKPGLLDLFHWFIQ
jgi:hypothetical protein